MSMNVILAVDNWRRRRSKGRTESYSVRVTYEDKTLRDICDEVVENMPPDQNTGVRLIGGLLRVQVKRS